MSTVAEALRAPYKGLSPFDDSELDAVLFFGRERETEIVVANALASRLTVLYGPSGVGKSSLLRAGVVHSMRKLTDMDPIAVAYYSSWAGDPLGGIEEAVRGALTDTSAAIRVTRRASSPTGSMRGPRRSAASSVSCSTSSRSCSSTTRREVCSKRCPSS
jgi:hypothetical protein